MQAYVLILLGWVLFGSVHSAMASSQLKANTLINSVLSPVYYRLAYNAVAILTFIPIWLALQLAPIQLVSNWYGSSWAGGFLVGFGLVVVVMAISQYDLAEFIGWPGIAPPEVATLRRAGLLRYVRHPLYSGILLMATGLFVTEPSWRQWLFGGCAFVYIRIGIYFEERKLVRLFGNQYVRFREQVPMLLPALGPKIGKAS